ncbi:MAG: vancomycin resistance protein VanJ [Flavobacteriaceae bacterium]|uniref:endonuclease/exonuclease/phosphatase family protein n=1 Tax=Candidatus Marifrigoribacter sp. Uisw_064 TaxID=3230970 RepID=UPI003AEAFADE
MGILKKIIYGVNIIVAILLIISFILPYVPPKTWPTLSVLSLAVSPLLLINFIFFLYWGIGLKKKALLSGFILFVAYFHFNPFFEFSSEGDASKFDKKITLLSYNVRLFNAYEKNSTEDVPKIISELIKEEEPDIISIQEYYKDHKVDFSAYPYQYTYFKRRIASLGHAIFSKYPLINKGAFDFLASNNNGIYADVIVNNDTLRIYNLHLQSMSITPSVSSLQEGNKDRLRKRIASTFVKQQEQVTQVLAHKASSKYPVLLSGDLNNTPFSYTYKELQKDMKDTFIERGNGLGTTYSFDSYPMRIDYIFTSNSFEVLKFKTIKNSFSDHYPIFTMVGWE